MTAGSHPSVGVMHIFGLIVRKAALAPSIRVVLARLQRLMGSGRIRQKRSAGRSRP